MSGTEKLSADDKALCVALNKVMDAIANLTDTHRRRVMAAASVLLGPRVEQDVLEEALRLSAKVKELTKERDAALAATESKP